MWLFAALPMKKTGIFNAPPVGSASQIELCSFGAQMDGPLIKGLLAKRTDHYFPD